MSRSAHNAELRALPSPVSSSVVAGLTDLLLNVVHAGASVSFMLPFDREQAAAYWDRTLASIDPVRGPIVLVAEVGGRVAGSVQLHPAWPPNQPHRADVAKLLVHTDFRRHGIARALMLELESHARRLGRTLLTLDTVTGSPADRLYRSLGYQECGTIPQYAMMPDGTWAGTTIFYKHLAEAPGLTR